MKSTTSGRFRNDLFPACYLSAAVVYYDRLSAKIFYSGSSPVFSYNIVSTWQEGCNEILHWAGFKTYPYEYWGLPQP